MLILTSFPFCAADCRSEKRSAFWPIFPHEGTRLRARHQSMRMESGRSAIIFHHPSLVYAAGQLTHHAAKKRQQEPGYFHDASEYLEYASHDELGEFKYYDECYHTTSLLYTQN